MMPFVQQSVHNVKVQDVARPYLTTLPFVLRAGVWNIPACPVNYRPVRGKIWVAQPKQEERFPPPSLSSYLDRAAFAFALALPASLFNFPPDW